MRYLTIVLSIFVLAGCAVTIPEPADRFTCMSVPSGAYKPGTVLRTLANSQDETDVDELTFSYLPFVEPRNAGSFADIEKTVNRGVSGKITTDNFRKLGFKGNLSLNAKYDTVANAKNNSHIISDDDMLGTTLEQLRRRKDERILPEASYFYVKEALASDSINYVATPNFGATINARVEAIDADADLTATIAGGSTTISGENKKLFACIVVEPLAIDRGAVGGPRLITSPTRSEGNPSDYKLIDERFSSR